MLDNTLQNALDRLQANDTTLTSLDLSDNNIGAEGANALNEALMRDGCNIIEGLYHGLSDAAERAMNKRKEHVEKLVKKWIEYKDLNPKPTLDIAFLRDCEKYSAAIKVVLSDTQYECNRVELAQTFDNDIQTCFGLNFLQTALICNNPSDTVLQLPELWSHVALFLNPSDIMGVVPPVPAGPTPAAARNTAEPINHFNYSRCLKSIGIGGGVGVMFYAVQAATAIGQAVLSDRACIVIALVGVVLSYIGLTYLGNTSSTPERE